MQTSDVWRKTRNSYNLHPVSILVQQFRRPQLASIMPSFSCKHVKHLEVRLYAEKNALNCSSNHQVMALLLYVSFITWCEDNWGYKTKTACSDSFRYIPRQMMKAIVGRQKVYTMTKGFKVCMYIYIIHIHILHICVHTFIFVKKNRVHMCVCACVYVF